MNKEEIKQHTAFPGDTVAWGYRDVFARMIEQLYEEGALSKEDSESEKAFFDILKRTSVKGFDHVIKNFLAGLNKENSWVLRIPRLLHDWADLGCAFANHKIYMGITFFEVWGKGAFGTTPESVSRAITITRYLFQKDIDLAYELVKSYNAILSRLDDEEVKIFIDYALDIYQRNKESGKSFIALRTETARRYIERISREARLTENKDRLQQYLRAIANSNMLIEDLGNLDSDYILSRGTEVAAQRTGCYLPAKVSFSQSREENEAYYTCVIVLIALAVEAKSFLLVHGEQNTATSDEYIRARTDLSIPVVNNAFVLFEVYRVIRAAFQRLHGFRPILEATLRRTVQPGRTHPAYRILFPIFTPEKTYPDDTLLHYAEENARTSTSFEETLAFITGILAKPDVAAAFAREFMTDLPPLPFFPDYMYPLAFVDLPFSSCAVDMRQRQEGNDTDTAMLSDESESSAPPDGGAAQDGESDRPGTEESMMSFDGGNNAKKDENDAPPIGFFYDEWNTHECDYYTAWCCLREYRPPEKAYSFTLSSDITRQTQAVRKVFERLKPSLARREKYLPDGDMINVDLLIQYLSLRKANMTPKPHFYEKPFINKRDIAVAILVDMSGSTGEKTEAGRKIIDVEKEAAYILAEGLSEVGDRFAIYGFTGNGREHAEYYLLKDFDESWEAGSEETLFAATPGSSTRMGVALRHTGEKLSKVAAKKKIIIMITDGKPMDSEYDPVSRYAHYDVRKANEENYKRGVYSFCISTEENRVDDLEIMFPFHRYVIIKSMDDLPKVLSHFYLSIT